jgi:hypothetical protein
MTLLSSDLDAIEPATQSAKKRGRPRIHFTPVKEARREKTYVTRHIHRVTGTRMNGYWVRVRADLEEYSKFFAIRPDRDDVAALQAAIHWRDEILAQYGRSPQQIRRGRRRRA